MTVKGAEQIEKALLNLDRKLARKIVRKALRPALKPILAKARALVPVESGALRKSLKLATGRRKRGEFKMIVWSGEKGMKLNTGEAFYGAFLELGHKYGKRPSKSVNKKTGDSRAIIPAKPFLRPAFDAGKERMIKMTEDGIIKGILEAWRER